MKKTYTVLFFVLFFIIGNATNQEKDRLIFNGDTLFLYESPLESFPNISKRISAEYQKYHQSEAISTGCWRGYIAEWKIIDSTLYLSNVMKNGSNVCINPIVEKVLGHKFKNGLLRANWVSGSFWSGKGLAEILQVYISVFKNEIKFDISKGHIDHIEKKDYIPCIYSDKKKIVEFIYEHINWDKLPDLNNSIRLSVYIESDFTGTVLNVDIYSSSDNRFNEEILRVAKLLPCLPVYFNKGVFYDVGQDIELTLDLETKKKYIK